MRNLSILFILTSIILFSCKEIKQVNTEQQNEKVEKVVQDFPIKVQFPSLDSIPITANVYEIDKTSPVVLLCHQARYNKFEYAFIAQKLNEKGFNAIAIDQRSGGPLEGHENETTLAAAKLNQPTEYLDAEQDIIAAINYVANKFDGPLILWGSSYSATLALYLGIESDKVDAIVSFSPGDYFAKEKGTLTTKLVDFWKPLFVTSSKKESSDLKNLVSKMKLNDYQTQFIPKGSGHHGSRALWENQTGGEEYWDAINQFLDNTKVYFDTRK